MKEATGASDGAAMQSDAANFGQELVKPEDPTPEWARDLGAAVD